MSVRALAVAVLLLIGPIPVWAQDAPGEVLEPPRGPAAERYLDHVGSRVHTDARYLSADASLDLTPPPPEPRERDRSSQGARGVGGVPQLLGWLAVIAILGALAYMLFQARFSDMFAGTEKPKPKPRRVELADMGTADLSGVSPEALTRMDDPREALRLLLLHALARAADANDIALRRSFTARDVLARVPGSWDLRRLLEGIVRRGELVLFGGRPFGRDDLAELLQTASPMFAGRRR